MSRRRSVYTLDRTKRPLLQESLVMVLDVLGYSGLIAEFGDAQNALDWYWASVRGPIEELNPLHRDSPYALKTYTDNVLVAWPLDSSGSENSEGEFGGIVTGALFYQLDLALEGLFVRGGLTLGQVYVGDDFVFGSPIIEAHRLESVHGSPPRVVLSDSVVTLATRQLASYGDAEDSPHNTSLIRQGDIVFLNYLGPLIDGSADEDEQSEGFERHKRILEINLNRHSGDDQVMSKYLWLAGFHNYVISRWCPWEERSCIDTAPLVNFRPFV